MKKITINFKNAADAEKVAARNQHIAERTSETEVRITIPIALTYFNGMLRVSETILIPIDLINNFYISFI